jgi:purine operon repressor
MKKLRRSARLVDMTQHLLASPHKLIPLTFFAEQYGAAKSSISEDLSIIKELFENEGVGLLKTIAGAAGGVKFIPTISIEEARGFLEELCHKIQGSERLVPGGYLFLADLLGNPEILSKIGKIFATIFADSGADIVMTIESKGIPLAYATAHFLNVPVVVVRRYSKVTDGSVVSINYVSGSSKRIQTMSLVRRSMPEHSKVLIIDDFMKAGGTARGMLDLLAEFKSEVAGIGVLVDTGYEKERLVDDYVSLLRIREMDIREKDITLELGNYFTKGVGMK